MPADPGAGEGCLGVSDGEEEEGAAKRTPGCGARARCRWRCVCWEEELRQAGFVRSDREFS